MFINLKTKVPTFKSTGAKIYREVNIQMYMIDTRISHFENDLEIKNRIKTKFKYSLSIFCPYKSGFGTGSCLIKRWDKPGMSDVWKPYETLFVILFWCLSVKYRSDAFCLLKLIFKVWSDVELLHDRPRLRWGLGHCVSSILFILFL